MVAKGDYKKPQLTPEHCYEGGVRLFRIWRLDKDGKRLNAITNEWSWEVGTNVCNQVPSITSSRSGFYGFNDCDQMRLQEQWGVNATQYGPGSIIGGTFIAWGRIVTAEMGARVEYARIESIIEPDGMNDAYLTILPTVATHYGIHIITEAQAKNLRVGLIKSYVDGMKL